MNFIFQKPYYNVAKAANELALEEAWNVYFEAMPQGGFAIRRRPAIIQTDTAEIAASGRGVIWSDRNRCLYVMRSDGVYFKPAKLSALVKIGTIQDYGLPAVFAEGQKVDPAFPIVYIANGGPLNYVDVKPANVLVPYGPTATPRPGPDILATFIATMNNMFYANDNTFDRNQDFLITDYNPDPAVNANDPLYWDSATNPWRATQKPDFITGITTGWNETYIWGTTACEVWQEDGVNPISPLMGSLMEIGLEAPYSIQMADNTFFLLATVSGKRCVIRVASRAPKVISEPIANILQSYNNVSDAVGSMCYVGGLNIYVLSFPSQNVTWAYDIKNDLWSQWSTWNQGFGRNDMFKGVFGVYASEWNQHVVLGTDGALYEFSRDVYVDDPGNLIHSVVRTGWVSHGTWDRKRCDQLIIKLQGYLQPAPGTAWPTVKLTMRTRDDGRPEWSNPIEIEIQAGTGQNDHYCKLNRMGIYRSRQYEFTMTDAQDLALIGMEEDITRMRN